MRLIEIFDNIPPASQSQSYRAVSVRGYSSFKIGRTFTRFPVLIASVKESKEGLSNNITLSNLSVVHNFPCTVEIVGRRKEAVKSRFSIVQCNSDNRILQEIFLEMAGLCISLVGNSPKSRDIDDFIHRVIEIFKKIAEPPAKTIQGLWAELFLIDRAKSPIMLLKSWHLGSTDKYDFNLGSERMEVKSYSSHYRVHTFSIEQLNPPYKSSLLIASVNTVRMRLGTSLSDLQASILKKISSEPILAQHLKMTIVACLGNTYQEGMQACFDYEAAESSIKFFESEKIPRIKVEEVPRLVFDVKFKVDLSNIPDAPLQKLKRRFKLLASIS